MPRRGPLIAMVLAALGALSTGALNYMLLLSGSSSAASSFLLPDPIGWALTARPHPLGVSAMVVALVLLVGLTWVFTRIVVRGSLPRRGGAVFFGTWGAIIIAALVSGVVRTPLLLAAADLPPEMTDIIAFQFFQYASQGAIWAMCWGWVTALVVALVHRSSRPPHADPHGTAPVPHGYAPAPHGVAPTSASRPRSAP